MAITSTVEASPLLSFGITETLDGDGLDNQVVALSDYEVRPGNLSSTSDIPVDSASVKPYSLSGGTCTIDLTAIATTTSSSASLSGKKIQGLRFTNPAGNSAMTITGEGTNGYSLGSAITIPAASASNAAVLILWYPEALADVASGDRYLVVTGTGSQSFYLEVLAG